MSQTQETPTRFEVVSPIRKDDDRFKPGDPIDLLPGEDTPLLKAGAIKAPSADVSVEDEAELGTTLDRLVSEGHEIEALKEMSVADFTELSRIKVKKADRVAALDLMVAENASTDAIAPIVEAIKSLVAREEYEDAELTADFVRKAQRADDAPWTDEQINTAITAFNLTKEED